MPLPTIKLIPESASGFAFNLGTSRSQARGKWGVKNFVLQTDLSREELIEFFLTGYRPTSILAPWNGGSGFYPKDRKVGLQAILHTEQDRFHCYRSDLKQAIDIVDDLGQDKGDAQSEEDERRASILRECRNRLSDQCVEWLDAAIAMASDGSRAFAPILGTGGNEGRLDYTNNFMERISELLISPNKKFPARSLLEHALLGNHTTGLQDIAVGQYDPGRSGGVNQGNGIEAKSLANPWNAVFTMEGAVAWAGGIYRKQGISYRSFLCSPFTVNPSAVGFGSAADKDTGTARAEIWAPLWDKPARYGEIQSVLREGRAAVDGRSAKTGLEFAEAAALLGVDRGITSFVRYSLLKRRGESYVALPAGRYQVAYRRSADLVRELRGFVDVANRAAKGTQSETPASWLPQLRAAEEVMFEALVHGDADNRSEQTTVDLLRSFGAMHRWLLLRGRDVRWRGQLREDWALDCCAHSAEARIAVALASFYPGKDWRFIIHLRSTSQQFSWKGPDLATRMLSTLRRRVLMMADSDRSAFTAFYGAPIADAIRFIQGELDESLLEDLVYALVLARIPRNCTAALRKEERSAHIEYPSYCLLKQFFTGAARTEKGDQTPLLPDLSMVSLLTANRVGEATDSAIRRLRTSGFSPLISKGASSDDGLRIGAALLIPIQGVKLLRDAVLRKPRNDEER